MAFRYRQRTVTDGDMIVPDDFNVNQREFVGEFNGYLDRDNLPQGVIGTDLITDQAFVEVRQKTRDTAVQLVGNSVQFRDVLTYSFTAEVDGMLTVDWSARWKFSSPYSATVTQGSATQTQVLSIGMYVNGLLAGFLYRSSDARSDDSKVIYGAMPVSAGNVEVKVRGRFFQLNHTDPQVMNAGAENNVSIMNQILVMIFRKR